MNPYIRLPRVQLVTGRQALILEKCKGKCVLHLGCVDAGLLEERFKRGELMHQRLAVVASELWGLDIDENGIEFLRSKGFDHLVCGDLCQLDKIQSLRCREFDVVVASEVIEHLLNPGMFLESVKSLIIPGITELIVTVPNAFRISNLIWLFRGMEYVHPDHNYWFSYYTASNLLHKTGFETPEIYAYASRPVSIFSGMGILPLNTCGCEDEVGGGASRESLRHLLTRNFRIIKSLPIRLIGEFLYRRSPFWSDGIILVARLGKDRAATR